jgi:hypothetical protein
MAMMSSIVSNFNKLAAFQARILAQDFSVPRMADYAILFASCNLAIRTPACPETAMALPCAAFELNAHKS